MTTYRKTKHGYGNDREKRNRGRPKREGQEKLQNNPIYKFNNFFNDEKRKPISLDPTLNNKEITLVLIKEFLEKIFSKK